MIQKFLKMAHTPYDTSVSLSAIKQPGVRWVRYVIVLIQQNMINPYLYLDTKDKRLAMMVFDVQKNRKAHEALEFWYDEHSYEIKRKLPIRIPKKNSLVTVTGMKGEKI